VKRLVVTWMAALSIAVVACGSDDDAATSSTKDLKSAKGKSLSSFPADGVATFYNADGGGNCGFDKTPNDLDVAAMDLPEYNGSAACGACLEVTGPKGKISVRVVDSCPGCEGNGVNLDLSASAFAKLAEPKKGRIDITYAAVPCDVSGNVQYHFKDGSSKYWTAIQVRNHKVAIAKLEYKKGSSWVEIERLDYNYFVADKGVGDQPMGSRCA
jgi:expansin (peptidoglycan-binding protein)